jgi:hypothetical protein
MTENQYEARMLELLEAAKTELGSYPADQFTQEARQQMLDLIYGDLQVAEGLHDPEFRKAASESRKRWLRDNPGQRSIVEAIDKWKNEWAE